jgi:hypothetical protein
MSRRELVFRSAQDVIDEIDRLQSSGYSKLKKWTLSQNCEHIGKTIAMGMHGSPFRLPWILRKTIGPMFISWSLRRGRIPAWFETPAPKPLQPKPTKTGDDDPIKIDWCREMIREAESFQGPLPPYPLADHVTLDQWRHLNWMHAAHHLGFLMPNG